MEKQPIVFAFYKDNDLVGYRQCTVGTIGKHAKVYHYSKEQVEIVLNNIKDNIKYKRPGLMDYIKGLNPKVGTILANGTRNIYNQLHTLGEFEIRIIPAPEIGADVDLWMMQDHDPIEVHKLNTKEII